MSRSHHLAVVGMAARLPGARDLDQYWANLREGVECVEFPTDEELRAVGVPDALLGNSNYVKARATAPGIQDFDSALFGYTPREADNSDPQIRMFLEAAHAALEHAGYNPYQGDATIAVYGSTGTNRYIDMHLGWAGDASATSSFSLAALNYTDHVATTAAYRLNLRGAAITVSTACSSSLVAIHLAGQALRNGECDLALAGGSELEMPFGHGYLWADGSPFSRDGHVRPFDVKADGTMFSSGAGVVVLKRLADALADGDTIHGVIRGSAVNNDGSGKAGFTAPSVHGQSLMLAEAFAMAEVTAADLSFVECHATGTPVGDPIEVAALHRALRTVGGSANHPIALGSVKSAIGHLGHSAGVASFIKAVLALRHGELPVTVNFTEANPKLKLDSTPFVIADRLMPVPGAAGQPKVSGVSSFGVGGTNAHVVVEEPPAPRPAAVPTRDRIVVWSAQSEQAALEYRDRLGEHFASSPDTFASAAFTLRHGRRAYPWRGAVVAPDATAAVSALAGDVIQSGGERRDVVFAFPGQGSQQVGMATHLYRADPRFAAVMDEALDLFEARGVPARADWLALDAELLTGTLATQALLFAVEYALARTLMTYGVTPVALIGHSLGELAAAAVAGVFSLADGVALVAARARAMAAAPNGGMLAVAASVDDLVGQLPPGLTVAVVNGPRQCVLSGTVEDVRAGQEWLRDRKIASTMPNTAGAFHSPLMLPAAQAFTAAFDDVPLAAPRIPVYSAASGGIVGAEQATDPGFWADQVAGPVRFDRAMDTLLADGPRLVLEVGPGHVLSKLGRQHDRAEGSTYLPVLPRSGPEDRRGVLAAVAQVWVEGHDVTWPEEDDLGPVRRVPVPGYPYQRRRHWVEPVAARAAVPDQARSTEPAEPAAAQVETPLSTITWSESEALEPATMTGHCLVLAPDGPAAMPLLLALLQAGAAPVLVRPGTEYAETAREFRVRPTEREDHERVLAELSRRGTPATLAVHALTLADTEPVTSQTVDDATERTVGSLLALAQAAAGKAGLLVVSRGAVDVTGAEPVDPAAAMLVGFARSLAKEQPELGCRVVDVGFPAEETLAAELTRWAQADVVALRGPRRWTAGRTPLPMPAPSPAPVRRQGVYIITGGTGGLGLALARGLAGTGTRPRLVLLSRTGLADDATDERSARLRAEVAELTGLGAEVRVVACDVTDRRALRRALDTATAQFGWITGVFHLAGVPGDGLVRTRDPRRVAQVLEPKTRGTLLLAEALRDRPAVDLFVCFSSRASTDGLVGSADYAAANAFQDAMVTVLRREGVPALSVNWPSWAKVGMAAEYGVRIWTTELGPDESPIMDEHRLQGTAVLPGTGHLELLLRGCLALTGGTLPVRLTDVVYQQMLASEKPRTVQIRLYPDGTVQSWSRPADDPTAEYVRHASARVARAGAAGGPVDVAALRTRLDHPISDADRDLELFKFGPRWDNVAGMWCRPGDTTELLHQLRLRDEFAGDLPQYVVHPPLLDSALTVHHTLADGFHLPFCFTSIDFYDSLPMEFYSHERRQPAGAGVIRADLDLFTPDGRVLVQARGYTMRKVVPGNINMAASAAPGADDGIDPELGVRLTLALLGTRHPGQVVVEPGARPVAAQIRPVASSATARVAPVTPVATAATTGSAPSTGEAAPTAAAAGAATADPLQERVRALWVEAIGDPNLSVDSDFFELGGDSLTAVTLFSGIREAFDVDVSIGAIFDYPTIAALTALLREQGAR